jgi:opacity protein-like surface antigen
MVATHDVDVKADNASGEVPFDNGFAGGVAVGYDFGKMRLEIEGSHRNSNAEEGDADLKVSALMANVYGDFDTGSEATPYLGVGVGVADVDIEDEDDQVIAGQLAAGVLFAVTEKVAIDLGYRFMMTDDPDIGGAELELRQHTAMLGVQIRF